MGTSSARATLTVNGAEMDLHERMCMDGIRDGVNGMVHAVSKASKEESKSLKYLSRSIVGSSAVQAADLLTGLEIDELEKLASLGDKADAYAEKRLRDETAQGMYLQLSDLGFMSCIQAIDGSVVFFRLTQKALWVVERRRKQEASDRLRQAEERRHWWVGQLVQAAFIALGWLLGLLTAWITRGW